ncbi:MAG TPA: hypothetical protein VG406_03820 [Isosphaeraceae bacterium]|jgi:dihydroorotate dehydrogenase|nr:hypothetical protein [Isosphaeraceae bacterium]
MPDWSYRTILRPLLWRLPPAAAREVSLGVMGALGGSAIGRAVIDFMGHMRPSPRLRRTFSGIEFPSAVGIGRDLDPGALALPALARFGVGFVAIGPISLEPSAGAGPVERDDVGEAIVLDDPPTGDGLLAMTRRLARSPRVAAPILAQIAPNPGADPGRAAEECRRLVVQLAPFADAIVLDWPEAQGLDGPFPSIAQAGRESYPPRPILLGVRPDAAPEAVDRLAGAALEAGLAGFVVDGGIRFADGRRAIGRPARGLTIETVRRLRQHAGPGAWIVGSGGIHEPEDAIELLEAGADLVAIDSGLVFGGPGLPKRVNEALHFAIDARQVPSPTPEERPAERSWFWALLLGVAMFFGGAMALAIAATRVVLPYDEQFAGLSRAQLAAINPRLLSFLAHDRASLAGTMLTIGILYSGLAAFGIRRGLHWTWVTVVASAFAGFGSFFLFLGFGYLDPFHAFVTSILFSILLFALHARLGDPRPGPVPLLREDQAWRHSQWGQLLLIVQATAFLVAGLVISTVGATTVFVHEDLEYLGTTAEALAAAGPRIVPLIAHDRATLGGMLLACGLAFLMACLWGLRRGERWLWWTLALASIPGYAAAIGVHFIVGYENPWHLAPAFAGLAIGATGLFLTYPHLCQDVPRLNDSWNAHLERLEQPGRSQFLPGSN